VSAPTCVLQLKETTDLYGEPFLEKSGLVFWVDDVDPNLLVGRAMVANPADCSNKRVFAKNLDFWFVVGDRGIVFSDDTDIDRVSLRYLSVPDGHSWPKENEGVLVQRQAGRIYSLTRPTFDTVIFQMALGFGSDGLYYAKLPF